jgi:uncharacterized protein YuzE
MKLKYFNQTDTLYIELSNKASTESIEISDTILADIDENGEIIGIEIEQASKKIDFSNFSIDIPFQEIVKNKKELLAI